MILATLLLGLGLVLVVAEVLFPSFGILGLLATAAIIGSVVAAFQTSTDTGYAFLGVTLVLLPGMILLGLKVFPRSPIGRHMVASGLSFDSEAATDPRDVALLGSEGELEADCRPTGVARLEGRRVDVVTRGEWLERGQRVRVVDVSGNRVVVGPVQEQQKEKA